MGQTNFAEVLFSIIDRVMNDDRLKVIVLVCKQGRHRAYTMALNVKATLNYLMIDDQVRFRCKHLSHLDVQHGRGLYDLSIVTFDYIADHHRYGVPHPTHHLPLDQQFGVHSCRTDARAAVCWISIWQSIVQQYD